MILINVKYQVKPEHADTFLQDVQWFTEATRAEKGNIFFDWFRSVDDPNEFVLLEAFQDDAAEPHVNSDHFKRACKEMPTYLVQTPQVINTEITGKTEWDELAEFKVEQ